MIHVLAEVEKNTSSVVVEMLKKIFSCSASLFLILIGLSSCIQSNKVLTISENELFKVNYGNFEEQLNLFDINSAGNITTACTMRDGFFYIVNGEAGKIISLNSYGDLLSLLYSEDSYSGEKKGLVTDSSSGIWKPVYYPFQLTSKIVIDSRKFMYVVGNVPKDRNEQSEDDNLLLSQVVLRISSDGKEIDYIGQQGPGGTPFPNIRNIYTTENNELVVVCTTNTGLCVYWFAINGFLRYKIPVDTNSVPKITPESVNSQAQQSDLWVTIENIVPDCYAERIYIKVDYYFPHIDEESKTQSGVDFVKSSVYPLNIENGVFGESLNIPAYEESVTEDFSKLTYRLPYDFLGTTKNGWMYFIITTEKGFNILMIQPGTQFTIKRNLEVDHSDVLYYSLSLSSEGIISALLCEKENARVVWWRSDSLIDSMFKS